MTRLLQIVLLASPFAWTLAGTVAASEPQGLEHHTLDARVSEAKRLLSENDRLEAARRVAPCLKHERTTAGDALEECLFVGEQISLAVIESQYAREPDFDALRREEEALGVEFEYGSYGIAYRHEYFRRLRLVFPGSRYSDLCAYVLSLEDQPLAQDWRKAETALEEYLSVYPEGRYAVRAQLDLAHIFDNVWELMRPETAYPSYRGEVTQKAEGDADLAESYREKALELYDVVIASPESNHFGISKHEYRSTVQRRSELSRGDSGNRFWIIDD